MASASAADIGHIVDHLAHLLPVQGPIGVFIHHNTLHAFQHLPFEEAVVEAARMFRTAPYMPEDAYRAALTSGRILAEDVDAVLQAEGIDIAIRRSMMIPGVRTFHPATVRWEIEEGGLLDGGPARELFNFWLQVTPGAEEQSTLAVRPRDGVLALVGEDLDDVVRPLMIKLASAYLDQGLAYWPMPNREQGFWLASLSVLGQPGSVRDAALRGLPLWVREVAGLDATAVVEFAMDRLGVVAPEPFLKAELLALPGWAGLMRQLESDPALAAHERVPASLMDFLAVRLLLTLAATSGLLTDTRRWQVPIQGDRDPEGRRLAAAAVLLDASRLLGFDTREPLRAEAFRKSVESFPGWERRRIWHLSYERRHERQILLPMRTHASEPASTGTRRPAAQVLFCIDEREESIRRHLEETDPEIETFGAAGFFGVAMNYTGIDDAHAVALCPVVVTPQHVVEERPTAEHRQRHERRAAIRRTWAKLARQTSVSSRMLFRGWLGTAVLGIFSLFPLAARVLSPRRYGLLVDWLNSAVLPEPRTELAFMRQGQSGHHAAEGLVGGFTTQEKVDRVASVLGPAGLRRDMARIVLVLGHGSTSLNNPHESAHDCGACGGRRGGPNARIFSAMANRPGVRAGLGERGILIPDDTWFVGGYHDTCNDDIDLYDLEGLPETHCSDLDRVRAALDRARTLSAHERARRFEAASPGLDAQGGLHHVQERAEHLAEPRPEYGHCTNSLCVVGRRSTTRGLFLDRRAFLASYDATQDPDYSGLASLLGAVVPICAGISLEYYFSFIDNEVYGCGTKLPHNVTGLVGVMNGYESDLRTGLPWQMVEIHEPVRILFVVEAPPDRVLETFRASPPLWEFLSNRWIRLATVDPIDGRRIHMYRGNGAWEAVEGEEIGLPRARSSLSWYKGRQEHLPVARIEMETSTR